MKYIHNFFENFFVTLGERRGMVAATMVQKTGKTGENRQNWLYTIL
jgi:hypothetical protein